MGRRRQILAMWKAFYFFSATSWPRDDYLITSVESIDHSFQVRFS
jgi:hypothetical protein